jgi:hypothetical protein
MKYSAPESLRDDGDQGLMAMFVDLKESMELMHPGWKTLTLLDLLHQVEKGDWTIGGPFSAPGTETVVNLSEANTAVRDYRRASEGGCQSCKHCRYVKPLPDETVKYCGLKEDEEIILKMWAKVDRNLSPEIARFWDKGCDVKDPILAKTVEQLLEGK